MKACMVENGMQFDEKEVSDLATALFEDAVQVMTPQKFVASKIIQYQVILIIRN